MEQPCPQGWQDHDYQAKGEVTMTDQTTNDRKISVSFSRKLSDGNYGTIEATAWVQGDAAPDATPGDVSILLADLFSAAKVTVLDQLGCDYEMDAEKGIIVEKSAPAPTTVQSAAAAVARVMPGTTDVSNGGDVRVMNPNDQDGPLPGWLVNACQRDGVTAVWDNRRAAAGTKQPHFKEAVARGATGRGKDGTAKGYWPPR
jgi:hypothetical protein